MNPLRRRPASRPSDFPTIHGPRHRVALVAFALIVACAATVAPRARAGQVRVNVVNFQFTPAAPTINLNDHVVWVWTSGTHTVTSGDGGTGIPSGVFDTGVVATGAAGSNTAFTWKSDRTGVLPYYCDLHRPNMAGTINVQAGTSAPVSDFRITEVLYRSGAGPDLIEITNMGPATGDLGRYRLAIPGDVAGIPIASVLVPPGGQVVIQPATAGTSTSTYVFLQQLNALADSIGSVALYAPNTIGTALTDATQMIDFVQYGASGQANEGTAITAGLWTALDFAPHVGTAGHSIEFCGNRASRGGDQWSEVSSPNFGSDGNCITPIRHTTWGRIKSLYR